MKFPNVWDLILTLKNTLICLYRKTMATWLIKFTLKQNTRGGMGFRTSARRKKRMRTKFSTQQRRELCLHV